jgi:hypothetical protein
MVSEITADATLTALMEELRGYPVPVSRTPPRSPDAFGGVVAPLQLVTENGALSFFSTTTIFGTPVDVTLSELAIESFFPADAQTAEALRRLALD